MNKLSISTLGLLLLLSAGLSETATAQFEGRIMLNTYEVNDGEQGEADAITLYVTPNRILMQSENSFSAGGSGGPAGIEAEGVLVRLDEEDFVFLTGDDVALTLSKEDITSFMKMFEQQSGQQSGDSGEPDVNYERTGETRQIAGYSTERFIIRDADGEDRYSDMWMTTEINITWGMLAEDWSGESSFFSGDDYPVSAVFREGYFPVRVENYEGGELTSVTEVTEVDQSGSYRDMVEIPDGVKVISFQEYIFQNMRNN